MRLEERCRQLEEICGLQDALAMRLAEALIAIVGRPRIHCQVCEDECEVCDTTECPHCGFVNDQHADDCAGLIAARALGIAD